MVYTVHISDHTGIYIYYSSGLGYSWLVYFQKGIAVTLLFWSTDHTIHTTSSLAHGSFSLLGNPFLQIFASIFIITLKKCGPSKTIDFPQASKHVFFLVSPPAFTTLKRTSRSATPIRLPKACAPGGGRWSQTTTEPRHPGRHQSQTARLGIRGVGGGFLPAVASSVIASQGRWISTRSRMGAILALF